MTKTNETRDARWIRHILLWHSDRAADELVSCYYDGLLAYICSQMSDREEAKNLAQESFIAALHSLASYDPRKAAFRTWLYRIATNKIIDYWRRTPVQAISLDAPRHLGESGDVQGWADSLELADLRQVDIAQGEVERDLLRRILQQVAAAAPEAQEVFRLHLYGGYNFAQISAMSGDSESTVKARYYRLLGQLRKDFSDERA